MTTAVTRSEPRLFPRSGLYAITADRRQCLNKLVLDVEAAIAGGACAIQYRGKQADAATRRNEAQALRETCRRLSVPFIVNDDITLARAIQADGVHVGRDDPDFRTLREKLGERPIIGVSCYASVDRALTAQACGASYVAFGRFFSSATKPHASPCPLSVLSEAKRGLTIPIVAIGGITPENGVRLIEAGADVLAVIGGIFDQPEPLKAAQRYQTIFN